MGEKASENQPRVSVTFVNAPSSWRKAQERLRKAGSHVGLILLLMVYTAGGAKVFQDIELPRELADVNVAVRRVMAHRRQLLNSISNSTEVAGSETQLRRLLTDYENDLLDAVRSGVDMTPGDLPDDITPDDMTPVDNYTYKWNYIHSLFFSSTVLTTIGYGNMAPRTVGGRIFCMLFAMIGIPLTVSVIADLGALFATGVSSLFEKIKRSWPGGGGGGSGESAGYQLSERMERALTVFVSVMFLVLYIAIGGGLFLLWENWSFLESFYFCFITMTTIGFGDFVPANAEYMLVCTVYILVGLALTTTIIEIVRRQYAQSWKQMKMLTARLQSLSGPLTDHLKKLGEHGHGGVTMDVDLLREIRELRKTMANANMKDGFAWDDAELDALTPRPPVLQIVIYESNV